MRRLCERIMEKKRLLFVINQFFKGGAETALLNLFRTLSPEQYEIDFLVFDQIDIPGTISLLPDIPAWIRVVDVSEGEGWTAFVKKAWFRLCRNVTHRQMFRGAAAAYLRNKAYDAAFSYGEWFSSRLVAEYVRARRKYVWVHADIDKASFLHPDIISYQQCFDRFIFVSKRSMEGATEQFPVLKGRCIVVHNLLDEEKLWSMEEKAAPEWFPMDGLPVLLTVANVRTEKNHLRQVRVMQKLFQEGKRFYWLNVGTLANRELAGRVKAAVHEAGLEDYFLLPGAIGNPYALMKRADAVCVLSDHESWSMVITEAKALGVPVIATRTSGALEQVEDGKSGMLCDFSEEDIAERIGMFLEQPEYREKIRANLQSFSAKASTWKQLEPLLLEGRKKIVYLFDNINYLSGARNAALAQMKYLQEHAEVSLFSIESCSDEELRRQYRTLDLGNSKGLWVLSTPCGEVLKGADYSWKWKVLRLAYALLARLGLEQVLPQMLLKRVLPPLLNSYDAVCVVSEASRLRGAVSGLDGPRKIQWIHTDYAAWREQSSWTRHITQRDSVIYGRFDTVVCLSEGLRDKFVRLFPQLEERTVAIPNFIQYDRIQVLGEQPFAIEVDHAKRNLITVGRMEKEKRYDLVLLAAQEMKLRGVEFHWYLVGDGPLLGEMQAMSRRLRVEREVTFTGRLENPCPLMKQCDAFVLLSDYEGTPVTIDEAKVLGVPVLARDVGGVREQLEGKYGRIIRGPDLWQDVPPRTSLTWEKNMVCQIMIEKRLEWLFEI